MPKAEPFIDFKVYGLEAMERNFQKGPEYLYGALLTILRKSGRLLVPSVKSETPVGATGKLRNSTIFQVIGRGRNMMMEIRQSAFSSKGYAYGIAIRGGTKPHFPPVAALIPWVIKKLGITNEKEARSVAFVIARKISKVGTKANPYHERALRSSIGQIRHIVNQEMTAFTERMEKF